jgi:WD40 repeat protein
MVRLLASATSAATEIAQTDAKNDAKNPKETVESHVDVKEEKEEEIKEVDGGAGVEEVAEVLQGGEVGVLRGHSSPVCAIVELPGRLLASCAKGDKAVRLWSTETMQCLKIMEHEVEPNTLWLLNDGRLVSDEPSRGVLHVWDAQQGQCLRWMRTCWLLAIQGRTSPCGIRILAS